VAAGRPSHQVAHVGADADPTIGAVPQTPAKGFEATSVIGAATERTVLRAGAVRHIVEQRAV